MAYLLTGISIGFQLLLMYGAYEIFSDGGNKDYFLAVLLMIVAYRLRDVEK